MPQDLMELMRAPPKPERDYSRSRLEPAYAKPWETWKATPNPQTASALVTAVKPVIDTAVKPLGDSPALRGRAKQIVLSAAGSYDPYRSSFNNHLMSNLQGLKRIAGQFDTPIHIPERVMLQQRDVYHATQELSDLLGREPSDSELADHTGLSVARLGKLRKYHRPVAESGVLFENDEGEVFSPAVETATPQAILEDFIYSDLTPRDQLIMDYALGRNGRERLPANIIARQLGITPGAVSQRLSLIQQRLNSAQDMELFGG